MAVVHLIRHARPVRTGIFLGRLDLPLVPQEIEAFALRPAAIYASPLRRARDTAERMFPNCDIRIVDDLAECAFGDWEGLTWVEIQRRWPEAAERMGGNWRAGRPPGGEAWGDFETRIQRVWERIREGPFPAAIVAHLGVNSVLARLVAGIDTFTFQQDYCEVLTLEFSH